MTDCCHYASHGWRVNRSERGNRVLAWLTRQHGTLRAGERRTGHPEPPAVGRDALRAYLIVSQDEKRIVAHVREARDRTVVTAFYEDALVIAPFNVVLPLSEVYRGVELD